MAVRFALASALLCAVVWATLLWPAAALVYFVAALVGTWLWRQKADRHRTKMPVTNKDEAASMPALTEAAPDLGELRRGLSLAAEHVHSIRWLLEIAREHQQPIPAAALKNLELVSKHLCQMRRRIDGGSEEVAPESEISEMAHRREFQTPPHPQRLSCGCHASPSDISTPFD